jgi:DNA-binding response OmpR family regulator
MDMRVLVVDDDPQIRALIEVALGDEAEVVAVPDGATALRTIDETAVHCAVLDVMMPGMSGLAVLEAIRADPRLRRMPVVMLTALAGEAQHVEAFRDGADAYLTKPFDVEELASTVREIVQLEPAERAARRQAQLDRAELLARIETSFGRE